MPESTAYVSDRVGDIELELDLEPDEALDAYTGAVMAISNVLVQFSGSNTIEITKTKIPVWAIVLAIILFPIGLLFLLVKETVNVATIRAKESDAGGSDVKIFLGRKDTQVLEVLVDTSTTHATA